MIYEVLTKGLGHTVYVDHVYRNQMSGKFQHNIDNIINKCKIFILLNTINALSCTEVIREVKTAFPDGELNNHEFWIFRQKSDAVPLGTPQFKEHTKIDLTGYTQHFFSNENELARILIEKCRSRENYIFSSPRTNASTTYSLHSIQVKNSKASTDLNLDQLREDARIVPIIKTT